ncbi:CRISPR-associated protein Csx18 [Calothrix sp. NIES-3974]|uniref:CRISPR-associated protein Csx18 n=1 Tax=Calothrix sp. NIES-3974 TaxID=2005462 RepID=UPI000B5F6844|nr:CRISPR-associated protein Csx18 [Calothrix sp. NIES-3974]BAZ04386.1 hypothetical protein NIES3974_10240 [Calothrix sp. NIES-3974]
MYISPRAAFIRNTLVSLGTGIITLVILLIAPLGLAAVIINTLLVTAATFTISTIADRVILWLEPGQQAELLGDSHRGKINKRRD